MTSLAHRLHLQSKEKKRKEEKNERKNAPHNYITCHSVYIHL